MSRRETRRTAASLIRLCQSAPVLLPPRHGLGRDVPGTAGRSCGLLGVRCPRAGTRACGPARSLGRRTPMPVSRSRDQPDPPRPPEGPPERIPIPDTGRRHRRPSRPNRSRWLGDGRVRSPPPGGSRTFSRWSGPSHVHLRRMTRGSPAACPPDAVGISGRARAASVQRQFGGRPRDPSQRRTKSAAAGSHRRPSMMAGPTAPPPIA
jgi:hypothetical protein